jgi:hypothetical protein
MPTPYVADETGRHQLTNCDFDIGLLELRSGRAFPRSAKSEHTPRFASAVLQMTHPRRAILTSSPMGIQRPTKNEWRAVRQLMADLSRRSHLHVLGWFRSVCVICSAPRGIPHVWAWRRETVSVEQ